MAQSNPGEDGSYPKAGYFPTTHWTEVINAGQSATPESTEALENLCQTYWYPLYAFVRRKGHNAHEAQDLTQEFFARILERHSLESADPSKGRFRTFLLTSLSRFMVNEWARGQCQKRGGGHTILSMDQTAETRYQLEPGHELTAEKIFERRWALTLLGRAMDRLREECAASGKGKLFDKVRGVLTGDKEGFSYAAAAEELQMNEGALRTAMHRLRQRYGEFLRGEIAQTVSSPTEVDEEIQHLFRVLGE